MDEAYDRALRDLAPWRPVGDPVEQRFDTGWLFRMGVGVVELGGATYTAQTVVALNGTQRVRIWALADSDDTFNRYKTAIAIAISSVQDLTHPAAAAPSTAPAPGLTTTTLDPQFGKGVSGAYIGLERGLRASAGAGGQGLVLDLATNYISIGNAPGTPEVRTSIQDYLEVDVFLPDGSYRRGLPIRGLGADLGWDRAQQPVFWGTWQKDGDRIVIRRGSYTTSYTQRGDQLVSDRERPWRKLPVMASVRVEGVFARDDFRDAGAPRLAFHADGTYEDRGGFLHMVGAASNLVVPDGGVMVSRWSDAEARRAMGGGSGTYTLEDYTLTLRDRDGRVWQINAYVPPTEQPPRTRNLVINTYVLVAD
jgi:hypothetical protein